MTRRGGPRKAAVDAKEIVLRIDGGGWHPSTSDPAVILTLAAAYVDGLRAVAKASELEFTMRGLEVRDECVAIGIGVDRVGPAIDAATELSCALAAGAPIPGTSMVVDRIRAALRSMPKELSATVKVGKRWERKLESEGTVARLDPVGELATMRARPIRAGGVVPAVRFSADGEPADFTLPCAEALSRELGAQLYREVEIEASIVRGADGQIEGGTLISFAIVDPEDDPAEAWERWFAINGKGWDDESVEAYIGRRED